MTEKRKVRLSVTFEFDKEFPKEWDDDMILFFCNESSSCVTNLLNDAVGPSKDNCVCCNSSVRIVELINDVDEFADKLVSKIYGDENR